VRFGVRLPHSGPLASKEAVVSVTGHAERLGFDSVLTHDHVNWGYDDRYHFYCGGLELADAHPRPTDFLDAFSTMAFLAGMTTRIRFVSSAIVLAWRHPLMAARLALTLHELSGARFVLGVCVGNVPKDFEVLGVDWDQRAAIAEEHLKALVQALREDGSVAFEGSHVRYRQAEMFPKAPDLPIWYGGTSPRGLVRAAQFSEGLIVGGTVDELRRLRRKVLRLREEYGRQAAPFTMATLKTVSVDPDAARAEAMAHKTVEERERAAWLRKQRARYSERDASLIGTPDEVVRRLRALQDAGVDYIGLGFVGASLEGVLEHMATFAETVMPAFAADGRAVREGA
jgi:alkanesulfonate monooxygenase SsuD/methylene tetrahydromethanopterin reductase-like flavin-dependent oxidoreductase (luciferase family)